MEEKVGSENCSSNNLSAEAEPVKFNSANNRLFSHIIVRAWNDEDFKNKLMTTPEKVFAEYSLAIPQNVKVKIVENTNDLVHFILPVKPSKPSHISLDKFSIHVGEHPLYCECEKCDCGTQK